MQNLGGGGTNCIMGNVKVANYVREKQSHPQVFEENPV